MSIPPYLDHAALTELASRSPAGSEICSCISVIVDGWQSQPLSLNEARLHEVGTLIAGDEDEPTFSEYHPDGTRYWSVEAPIAARYFPYNRCTVWQCGDCQRSFLRYTEGGGYFVDRRIRRLDASLIVDAGL